ncbi:MAG: hypothetical protein IKD61_09560 [Oscillospiraceae bacterium]|nr:hypothetical protein [Oscillospiraceae bacterium]
MDITAKAWQIFIAKLRRINEAAAQKILAYLTAHPIQSYEDRQKLIEYAYLTAQKYGEGAAALACRMYDEIAAASTVAVPAAVPAAGPSVGEVAKTINGTLKTGNPNIVSEAVGRLVKQTGVDTTMRNALRDGAEWAWIPSGDTCAFCITLASRGWQRASRAALKNGHAEHIHANCDCTYAVRFDTQTDVAGYHPDEYRAMYEGAEGRTPTEKINAMRREFYAENKDEINAQKRDNYEKRKERESSAAEEIDV